MPSSTQTTGCYAPEGDVGLAGRLGRLFNQDEPAGMGVESGHAEGYEGRFAGHRIAKDDVIRKNARHVDRRSSLCAHHDDDSIAAGPRQRPLESIGRVDEAFVLSADHGRMPAPKIFDDLEHIVARAVDVN